jgi:hypothetical protein
MKIRCIHGYFQFQETKAGELSEFIGLFPNHDFVSVDDYFTFSFLSDVPTHSIPGADFKGLPAVETFEGKPWEVMRVNEFVYDFNNNLMVPINAVVQSVKIQVASNYLLASGLIL